MASAVIITQETNREHFLCTPIKSDFTVVIVWRSVISVSAVRLMEVKLLLLDLRSVYLKSETALRYGKYEYLVLFENCHDLILVFDLMLAYTFFRIAHLKYGFVDLFRKCCLISRMGLVLAYTLSSTFLLCLCIVEGCFVLCNM